MFCSVNASSIYNITFCTVPVITLNIWPKILELLYVIPYLANSLEIYVLNSEVNALYFILESLNNFMIFYIFFYKIHHISPVLFLLKQYPVQYLAINKRLRLE